MYFGIAPRTCVIWYGLSLLYLSFVTLHIELLHSTGHSVPFFVSFVPFVVNQLAITPDNQASFLSVLSEYNERAGEGACLNRTRENKLGRGDSNLRSRRQRPLPYRLATP